MSLKKSLKDLLDDVVSDPLEQNRRIVAAIIAIGDELSKKLDADTGVTDNNYQEVHAEAAANIADKII